MMAPAAPTALILAAGFGSRLRHHTAERPKCLVPVGGRPILDRTLQGLSECGIPTACIVVGYRGEQIRRYLAGRSADMEIRIAENPAYATTGTCVSVLEGLGAVGNGAPLLIVEGDVVFETALLGNLLARDEPCRTVLAPYHPSLTGTYATLDGAGWVSDWLHERARPADFDLRPAFKTVNITALSADAVARMLMPALHRAVETDGPAAPLEFALRRSIHDYGLRIRGCVADGAKWFEVDDEQDLRTAQALFAEADDDAAVPPVVGGTLALG
jgi:choline kinase